MLVTFKFLILFSFLFLQHGIYDVELSGPPSCYEVEFQTLLTADALNFIVELVRQFDNNVEQVCVIIIIVVKSSFSLGEQRFFLLKTCL